MNQQSKIAVIGGSGKSGQYLLKELIEQGFRFRALLRNPDNFLLQSQHIEVVKGNVTDLHAVQTLIEGCEAVISTLGLGIPASEPTIFSRSATNIIQAMNICSISRYIVTTGLNVDTPFDNKSAKTTMATEWMKTTYPLSTANKQLEYETLVKSNIDWTLVRLPLIEQTNEWHPIRISETDCPGDRISATSLARFLIEQLLSTTYIRKSPFIANA